VAQLERLNGFAVNGMNATFDALTNLVATRTAGGITVSGGGIVSAPNLVRHIYDSDCHTDTWLVTGTGSVLDFPGLATLSGPVCGWLNIEATAGGVCKLGSITNIMEGLVNFVADGMGSRIDLAALDQSLAVLRVVSFTALNSGTISIPLLEGGPTVNIAIQSGGILDVAQMNLLKGLTVSGTTLVLPGITHLFNGNLTVNQGAILRFPNLVQHGQSSACTFNTWTVQGPDSELDLSSITSLTGNRCGSLTVQALGGGRLLLPSLTNIPSGAVQLRSADSGSIVDLSALASFLNARSESRLVTTNGGTLLLSDEPLVLSGVGIQIAPGSPGLSPTHLAATNLVLHGRPWDSYWIDARETASPFNPWKFFRRVPLTNEFQVIAPAAAVDTEFQAFEFVAEPYALELNPVPGAGVDVVLFGPTNVSFEVQAISSVVPPIAWPTVYQIDMTNSFRLLPREPLSTPQRFFRVRIPQ
jgi:hypothetical protein